MTGTLTEGIVTRAIRFGGERSQCPSSALANALARILAKEKPALAMGFGAC